MQEHPVNVVLVVAGVAMVADTEVAMEEVMVVVTVEDFVADMIGTV